MEYQTGIHNEGDGEMKTYEIVLEGRTPLMTNRWTAEEGQEVRPNIAPGGKETPEEAAADALYKDSAGRNCVQNTALKSAFETVATAFLIGGKGKKTYKDHATSFLTVGPPMIPIEPQEYVIDSRRVRVPPRTGSPQLRHRPRFDNWKIKCTVQDAEEAGNEMPLETIQLLINRAGKAVGIGDGRKILFGRFALTSFKEIKELTGK